MSDTTPRAARFNLADEIKRIRDAEPGFILALGDADGTEITVPPTALWDDELLTLANTQPAKAAVRLVGAESYRKYTDAGGTAALLMRMVRDHEGAASLGESEASANS